MTDVLLVGSIDGVFRSLNPLGNPADSDADYWRVKVASAEVASAGAHNDLIFTAHGNGEAAAFTGAHVQFVVTNGVVQGAETLQALAGDPKNLVFQIHADTTALDIIKALNRSPDHLKLYSATLKAYDTGIVNSGAGKVANADVTLTAAPVKPAYREFGLNLPTRRSPRFPTRLKLLPGARSSATCWRWASAGAAPSRSTRRPGT
ncbi:MAG: hypothetical protein IPK39_05870 [Sulfuritalea sp.]|nr:hypothetical protein [Sulfuritalea sp.]